MSIYSKQQAAKAAAQAQSSNANNMVQAQQIANMKRSQARAMKENEAVVYEIPDRPAPSYKAIAFGIPENKQPQLSRYIQIIKDSLDFEWVEATEEATSTAREAAQQFGDIYKGWLAADDEPERAILASLGYNDELATFVYDEHDDRAKMFCQCLAICANAYDSIADTDDIRHWPSGSKQEIAFVEKHGISSSDFCLSERLISMIEPVKYAVELFGPINIYGWERLRKRAADYDFLENYSARILTPQELECAGIYEQVMKLQTRALSQMLLKSTTQASDERMRKINVAKLSGDRVASIMEAASSDTATFKWEKSDLDKAREIYQNTQYLVEIWESIPELTEAERAQAIRDIKMTGGDPQYLPERIRAVAFMRNVDVKMGAAQAGVSLQALA